jgi:hypothetical protein
MGGLAFWTVLIKAFRGAKGGNDLSPTIEDGRPLVVVAVACVVVAGVLVAISGGRAAIIGLAVVFVLVAAVFGLVGVNTIQSKKQAAAHAALMQDARTRSRRH